MGLVAPQHMGSSWTRDQTHVPCVGRQILNHCATREVPLLIIFKHHFVLKQCCFFPGNSIMPFNWGNVTPIKMEKVMIHNRKVRKARCSVFSMLAGESVRCFGKKKFPYSE